MLKLNENIICENKKVWFAFKAMNLLFMRIIIFGFYLTYIYLLYKKQILHFYQIKRFKICI